MPARLNYAAEVYGRLQEMSDEAIASATAIKVDALAKMGGVPEEH